MLSFWVTHSRTGAKQLKVNPGSGSVSRKLNGVGTGRLVFNLRDDGLTDSLIAQGYSEWDANASARATRRALFQPWKRAIVAEWDGVAKWAGVIQRVDYQRSTGELTVQLSEYRTFLTRRFLFGIGEYEVGTRNYSGKSLRSIAAFALFEGTQGAPSPYWDLPFDLPIIDESGPHARDYWNYAFQTVETIITELQDTENGPDIDFDPYWTTDGRCRLTTRLGSPSTPQLSGPAIEVHATAEEPSGFDVVETIDGSAMVTGVFTIGSGSEAGMRWGQAAVSGANDAPSLDVTRPWKDIDDVATLNAHAQAEANAHEYATDQYRLAVPIEKAFPGLVPGSPVTAFTSGDEFIDDGKHVMRTVGFTIDVTDPMVTIDVQEAA